jgi:hypothetical protein
MSSARIIVHCASPNLGIGRTEHERPLWVVHGRPGYDENQFGFDNSHAFKPQK